MKVPPSKSKRAVAEKAAPEKSGELSPSSEIDAMIADLADWRGQTLALVRKLIKQAEPEVVEEVKWRKPSNGMKGVPVWEHEGIICTGETYKSAVKLTFAKGASVHDPSGLFNSSLEGNARRAIDIHEGDKVDEKAFKALFRAAVVVNTSAKTPALPVRAAKKAKTETPADPEAQLESYFAAYEPVMVNLGKALRAKMRKRLPGLNELVYVYENQGSLVIAYSPTDQGGGSDAPLGIALYADCAKLFFTHGAELSKSAPGKLLQGSGKTARHVVLNAATDLDRPEIEALMAASLKLAGVSPKEGAEGSVIIKAEAQKQRAAARKKRG